jgi:Xaa-Pro aminopeptidase
MLPGRMGFHVEDMYLITEDGFDVITGDKVPNDEIIALNP